MSWYTDNTTSYYVNRVAFATTAVLSIAAGAGIFGFAAATSTTALVALGLFSTVTAGAGLGSMTAWASPSSDSVEHYFETLQSHVATAAIGMLQFVVQTLFQSAVQGAGDGLRNKVYHKFA